MFEEKLCSDCIQIKKIKFKKQDKRGNKIFVDETDRRWRCSKCPDCARKYHREWDKRKRRSDGMFEACQSICISCNSEYTQRLRNQVKCRQCALPEQQRKASAKSSLKRKRTKVVSCKMCATTFEGNDRKVYCSDLCRGESAKTYKPEPRGVRTFSCLRCSKEFESTRSGKFCSRTCRRIVYRTENKEKIKSYPSYKTSKKKERKKRKSLEKGRVPSWANKSEIVRIYQECPEGMQVDHIIPLKGKNVSGLHVEYNLQYLSPKDNESKSNKSDGTYSNLGWKKKG